MYPYDVYSMNMPNFGFVRILHASPDAPGIDVYANNRLLVKNLAYSKATRYFRLFPGNYNIRVFISGKTDKLVVQKLFTVMNGQYITIAAINKPSAIELFPIPDIMMIKNPTRGYLRFVHLSPNAPNVDIKLANGNILFENVKYKQISPYLPFKPRTINVNIFPTGTNKDVLKFPVEISTGISKTAYIIGLVGARPELSNKTLIDDTMS